LHTNLDNLNTLFLHKRSSFDRIRLQPLHATEPTMERLLSIASVEWFFLLIGYVTESDICHFSHFEVSRKRRSISLIHWPRSLHWSIGLTLRYRACGARHSDANYYSYITMSRCYCAPPQYKSLSAFKCHLKTHFSSQLTQPPSDPPSNAPWFFNRLRRYISFVLTYLLTYRGGIMHWWPSSVRLSVWLSRSWT